MLVIVVMIAAMKIFESLQHKHHISFKHIIEFGSEREEIWIPGDPLHDGEEDKDVYGDNVEEDLRKCHEC